MIKYSIYTFFLSLAVLSHKLHAQDVSVTRYEIGAPSLNYLWVDPTNGSDSNSGATRARALRTVTTAWGKIPLQQTLTTGYQINLVSGLYSRSILPNYWESRYGTYQAPIIINAVDGVGTAVFQGDMNIFDTQYLYMLGVNIITLPAGDAFHCEQCDHILLRQMELSGGAREARETIKFNQSQYVYIEDSDIHGANDNAIDFVSVQYGHIVRNRVHNAEDWCAYTKGGSAYLLVEGNRFYNCGTGGFTAGQGTGFEFISSPWIHYEAYDIKFINNLVYDIEGAGMGVSGGYNILLANNTLFRTGSRSHIFEIDFGQRSCDGNTSACAALVELGGWGTSVADVFEPVPSKNVFVYNNIFYNPTGTKSGSQHFAIYGPRAATPQSNIPTPAHTDENLCIKGNIIWNGPSDYPLGIEEADQGCQSSNTTCTQSQLIANNYINQVFPQFANEAALDLRPSAGGSILQQSGVTLVDFAGGDREATPLAPQGLLDNLVARDFSGAARNAPSPPGAYYSADSLISNPIEGASPTVNASPTISSARCTPRSGETSTKITCSATVNDDRKVSSVVVQFSAFVKKKLSLQKKSRTKYTVTTKLKAGKFSPTIIATDSMGAQKTKSLGAIKIKKR